MKKDIKIFLVFLCLFALFTRTDIASPNDASRMATIESLVNYHSFTIDNSRFIDTIDKYFYEGHFYSDKPPILSLYASVFYLILNKFNINFLNNYNLTYYLLTLSVVGVSSCLGLVYFAKTLELFKINGDWSNLILLITGVGTLILPYSTVFNNHTVSGALLLFSFYNLLRIEEGIIYNILAGFFIALAGSIDITFFTFLPLFAIVLFKKNLKIKSIFIFSCMPMIIIYFWLNYYNSGSLIPAAMNKDLWEYPGSVFSEQNLSGLAQQNSALKLIKYSVNMLIGEKGLFSYTPILLFSIFALIKTIFLKKEFKYKKEYLFIAVASLAFVLFYCLRTNNYSGYSYGIRWFVSLMFVLCIPLAHLDAEIKRSKIKRILFITISCISIFIAFIGTVNPFTPTEDSISFVHSLPLINDSPPSYKIRLVISICVVYYFFYKFIKKVKLEIKSQK